MNNRILFIIFNNEVKYMTDSGIDHREWFLSLGGDINNYDNTIRGFIVNGQIIFFKANLSYDNEVVKAACKYAPSIRQQMNNSTLKVYCGINPGQNGSSWEPITAITEDEITKYNQNQSELLKYQQQEEERQKRINRETDEIIEFKNNYDDPKFIKFAITFNIIILILTVISKLILNSMQKFDLSVGTNILLVIGQVAFIILAIIGYSKKNDKAKYYGLAASAFLFFAFNIIDIIIGIVNLFFTIDQGYILNAIKAGKKGISKISKK